MAILITKIGAKYSATVTPPHSGKDMWSTADPVDVGTLVNELKAQGCNYNDIGDAFLNSGSLRIEPQ
ncbi:MAG: hypothetical protein R3F42_09860 [Pseudomonadota bacterium]